MIHLSIPITSTHLSGKITLKSEFIQSSSKLKIRFSNEPSEAFNSITYIHYLKVPAFAQWEWPFKFCGGPPVSSGKSFRSAINLLILNSKTIKEWADSFVKKYAMNFTEKKNFPKLLKSYRSSSKKKDSRDAFTREWYSNKRNHKHIWNRIQNHLLSPKF